VVLQTHGIEKVTPPPPRSAPENTQNLPFRPLDHVPDGPVHRAGRRVTRGHERRTEHRGEVPDLGVDLGGRDAVV
jgi:hypothetical protein